MTGSSIADFSSCTVKFAFIHPRAPGTEGTGAAHSSTRIVDLLQEAGFDVIVYCLAPMDEAPDRYTCRRIDLGGFSSHSAIALNAWLRDVSYELGRFDLVHSYLPKSLPAMSHVGRETSAATIVSLNAYGGMCPKNDLRYLDREPCRQNGPVRCTACSLATSGGDSERGRLYRSASRLGNLWLVHRTFPGELDVDGFQALSSHVKEVYVDFGYSAEQIAVLPNILDENFLVEHRSDFSAPFRLLYVGTLKERKGVLMIPEILQWLDRRRPGDFRMTVVGDGGARRRLEEGIEERRLGDQIDLQGSVPYRRLPAIYAAHDLFVFPAVWEEPFGRVLIESLAAGTPVVGSDVGAVDEIVGEAGEVAEPRPRALASTILEMVDGEGLTSYAKAGKEEATRYGLESVGPKFLRFYRDVVRGTLEVRSS